MGDGGLGEVGWCAREFGVEMAQSASHSNGDAEHLTPGEVTGADVVVDGAKAEKIRNQPELCDDERGRIGSYTTNAPISKLGVILGPGNLKRKIENQ